MQTFSHKGQLGINARRRRMHFRPISPSLGTWPSSFSHHFPTRTIPFPTVIVGVRFGGDFGSDGARPQTALHPRPLRASPPPFAPCSRDAGTRSSTPAHDPERHLARDLALWFREQAPGGLFLLDCEIWTLVPCVLWPLQSDRPGEMATRQIQPSELSCLALSPLSL